MECLSKPFAQLLMGKFPNKQNAHKAIQQISNKTFHQCSTHSEAWSSNFLSNSELLLRPNPRNTGQSLVLCPQTSAISDVFSSQILLRSFSGQQGRPFSFRPSGRSFVPPKGAVGVVEALRGEAGCAELGQAEARAPGCGGGESQAALVTTGARGATRGGSMLSR